jgi:hypothetical protein
MNGKVHIGAAAGPPEHKDRRPYTKRNLVEILHTCVFQVCKDFKFSLLEFVPSFCPPPRLVLLVPGARKQ